eukprot:TRINITY_DN826_c0_g1_i1.p1 TRINITY_DN826_c0_g1~~TRINITY_DN826_c0_g1_i1.p1  ORF type:complete len:229 (+),score=52.66 TRINITY_DN826_c0_g1_i1:666-1352(+)
MMQNLKLTPQLANLLGFEVGSRNQVLTAFWDYATTHKLQDQSDKKILRCNEPLKALFSAATVPLATITDRLSQFLHSTTIDLFYNLNLQAEPRETEQVYDVEVDCNAPYSDLAQNWIVETSTHQPQFVDLDSVILEGVEYANELARKRDFFLSHAASPAVFMQSVIASQNHDAKIVAGEALRNTEAERRSELYRQPWTREAVARYLDQLDRSHPERVATMPYRHPQLQ